MAYPYFTGEETKTSCHGKLLKKGGHNHHDRNPNRGTVCTSFCMSSCVLGTPGKLWDLELGATELYNSRFFTNTYDR